MPSHDLRTAGAFNPVATAGTTEVWPFTIVDRVTGDPATLTSLSVWLGGTVTDADATTGATEYVGDVEGNVATVTVAIPDAGHSQPCRVFIDGILKLIGILTPSTRGTSSAVDGVTVAVGDVSITVETGATYTIEGTGFATTEDLDAEETARIAQDAALDSRLDTLEAVDLAPVATSGDYADLTGTPTLGTAAAADTGDFDPAGAASAAQAAAISAAATDATTKAAAAQAAAIAAAATDAAARVTALVNSAPAGGDTLGELDARLAVVEALGSLATDAELVAAVAALIGTADTAGDTLGELQSLIGLRLLKSANLSDLANAATARTNLGLGTAAVVDTGTADANVPTNAQVDVRHSLGIKAPARLASTANLSGLFLSTTAQEIGNGALTVDGVATAAGDVILLKDQSTGSQNGLWTVTQAGSAGTPWQLARLVTADAAGELVQGVMVRIMAGSVNSGRIYELTTTGTVTPGTTAQTWSSWNPRSAPIQTKKSDGDLAINTTTSTWQDLDTSGSAAARNLDVVIPGVKAGDWVSFNPSLLSAAAAVGIFCDVFTIVAGSPVNQFGTATGGVSGWFMANNTPATIGAPVSKQLVSGDIENGSVRLRFRTLRLIATARAVSASSGNVIMFEGRGPFV